MKFLHISDLHLGKRVNEFSMLDEQKYILASVIDIIDSHSINGVFISGDIYDKSVPNTEAVELFDDFLYKLSTRNLHTFIISGNHDSPERVAFAFRLMEKSDIYISPVYSGNVSPITISDEYGKINIYMLPFIKPAHVKRYYPDAQINSYTDALDTAIKQMQVDTSSRNILLTHQFVTGALRSDSEDISVGGSDNVDVTVFDDFDYVALGHLHRAQQVSRETIRYCGTLLKYSLAEVSHIKSVTIVEFSQKGEIDISVKEIKPRLDMRMLKGKFAELCDKEYYEKQKRDDYLHVILTEENESSTHLGVLRTIYPNIMKLEYDNLRTKSQVKLDALEDIKQKDPLELFSEFYSSINHRTMSDEQNGFVLQLIDEVWGEKS